jgi:hypothetical protein
LRREHDVRAAGFWRYLETGILNLCLCFGRLRSGPEAVAGGIYLACTVHQTDTCAEFFSPQITHSTREIVGRLSMFMKGVLPLPNQYANKVVFNLTLMLLIWGSRGSSLFSVDDFPDGQFVGGDSRAAQQEESTVRSL